MVRKHKALEGSRASQDCATGFAGNDSTVCCLEYTRALQTLSSRKAHVVDLLSCLFELGPAQAVGWTHVVHIRLPWFKEA
jgi:hypothetical protein